MKPDGTLPASHLFESLAQYMNRASEGKDLTNQIIGGYSILHRVGVGGMSEVYLAFQNSLHRHVALKVLRADFVGSEEHEQRFLQEARSVASLIHPNIVQVYDIGKFDTTLYIAQEYVPGSNLSSFIQRRGALPVDEAVSILWQATSALQKAASIGLVHRDIKPDNLLLTPDGEVKVADFGLARARGKNQNLTAVGVALGTPLYMSPEQVQGLSVDSRSDLYSLGATAYHMLSGRPPFSGDTALALAMQHIQAEPVPLGQLRPDLPKDLIDIVHRLLKKSPEDRFASAMELARELRNFIDAHLEGRGDKMVPFSGLVIDHQAITSSVATEELQVLLTGRRSNRVPSVSNPGKKVRLVSVAWVWLLVPLALGSALSYTLARVDLFSRQTTTTAGVLRESTIERQYALALSENNLKNWTAVSEYFPPTDAVSRSYFLKSQLQIARLRLEGDDFAAAESSLRVVVDSPYSDEIMRTIAHIELGWIQQRLRRQTIDEEINNESYNRAVREMSILIPEKQRTIRDALPPKVRAEWETVDYLSQTQPKPSGSTLPTGKQ
ncbi:MAG: serine/threonine-protein kinase [Planctomycetota bacterium]